MDFDDAKFMILNFALGRAHQVKINGAKQPYNGLPSSTVDLTQTNKSKMMVDWARVTKK